MSAFVNQALNTMFTYGSRPLAGIKDFLCADFTDAPIANPDAVVTLTDARDVDRRSRYLADRSALC